MGVMNAWWPCASIVRRKNNYFMEQTDDLSASRD